MRAVIIAAGRGSRLERHTDEIPKTLVPVVGRPMIDSIVEALLHAGFSRKDLVVIGGYRIEVLKAHLPDVTFVENRGWEGNNILLSLLAARELLHDGFVATYADIVYTPWIARRVATSSYSITLGCDTAWTRRYEGRTMHPPTDAEKLIAEGSRVLKLSRTISPVEASGEFIGVARFDAVGARQLLEAFDEAQARYAGREFREGRSFERAYLIDLLQDMIERGVEMHQVSTHGGYMEIDTVQDHAMAERWWADRPQER